MPDSLPNSLNIEEIFTKYKNKVYRLALSISRNEKDAEDIMQNTFLKITKNLIYFRNKSLLSTWIYKIAYNEALMYLRKKKTQLKLTGYLKRYREKAASGLFVNWAKLPDQQLLDKELKERIDEVIRNMPIRYRMPLLLNSVEELPLKNSAVILGLKINSLKTRLHRARLGVRSEISDYFRDREGQEIEEKKNRKCNIWIDFVYSYAHGNLGRVRNGAFKRHIKDCLSCNSFLDTYLKAIDITRALQCQDLPVQLKDKIETFLRKQ